MKCRNMFCVVVYCYDYYSLKKGKSVGKIYKYKIQSYSEEI